MATRVKTHRASAQRRRAALLEAAAEQSAELGAGAVTHRAVAARAGVPLSTTSYFFSSIDELVTEALRLGAKERAEISDQAERAAVEASTGCIDMAIGAALDRSFASSRAADGSQVEFFLAAGRQSELRPEATEILHHKTTGVAQPMHELGCPQAEAAAAAMTDLSDGALLHRLAALDVDHRARLAAGLRLLTAAAMLTDDEVNDLLGRYPLPVDTSGATRDAVAAGLPATPPSWGDSSAGSDPI